MIPTDADLNAARELRRLLHRTPELSGVEVNTAARIAAEMTCLGADRVETGIGGHGLLAFFEGAETGPLVVLRAELDALPIIERSGVAHASEVAGQGHLCGHDGHMAILFCVARVLARARPRRGSVALLFQPAEETGAGARAMLRDPRIGNLRPTRIFALHNLPGLPLGYAALAEGPIACASRGMRLTLQGRTAHASQPETGLSPRTALSRLLGALDTLNAGLPLEDPEFAMATVTHCRMGAPAFGVAPGEAEIWTTLRTLRDDAMARLCARAEEMAQQTAHSHGLALEVAYDDVFNATENHPDAVATLRAALDEANIPHGPAGQPWRPSEDFGAFAALGPSAMLFFGSGENHPALHDHAYDFPDMLIAPGAQLFLAAIERALSSPPGIRQRSKL
ncbi:putative hydrolase YxeP [Jannaschia seosinensis]|uniref:Putative hydrolase YxeP n=1 Tax=Jannaschia seosinensis TaxID=313367 RepID=A0A0M7BFI2_9RHOB|nr:amidohydrolase [Jannaschia seosinensis]CUH40076.1 putative hydrolase YxeP [Jannaschia seosinensis]